MVVVVLLFVSYFFCNQIACEAIVQHIRSNGINQVRLIHIHQAYSELKLTMDNLSAVMSLTVHYRTNPITSQALKAITTDKVGIQYKHIHVPQSFH